ncbi:MULTISPECIES: GntR family transcriptional regulator [Streptomyces]|uniref:GntR family transcriptional regulator n=1 Tax=Streptomyces TaxID=1883 RepID=UPI001CCAB9EF|nr:MULTISPECIES: GntR family transcriptional regulator [Streptomyces]UBI40999.1 GntR family transcriptional regulator [Streptomyces mobaraensis]UKW33481.1 GntR family transcriptional regulator [Streptomyces sp. TYQ1024]
MHGDRCEHFQHGEHLQRGETVQRGEHAERGEYGRGASGHGGHAHAYGAGAPAAGVGAGVGVSAGVGVAARRMPTRYSVRGQVLDALRKALVSGELIPGEVYSGPALAERFGVSATPVREAMQQLVAEGAVEAVPNRGFRVTSRSARDLAELAEVRGLLEVPVLLRLACTLPAARWRELLPLAETAETVARGGDRAAYAEADRAFHRALLGLGGNRQLVTVTDELHRRAQWPTPDGPVRRTEDLVADAAEHVALLDALAARDLPAVEALLRGHYTGAAH